MFLESWCYTMFENTILSKFNEIESTLYTFFDSIKSLKVTKTDSGFCEIIKKYTFKDKDNNILDQYGYRLNVINLYDAEDLRDIKFSIAVGFGTFPNNISLSLTVPYFTADAKLKFIMDTLTKYKNEFLKEL